MELSKKAKKLMRNLFVREEQAIEIEDISIKSYMLLGIQ